MMREMNSHSRGQEGLTGKHPVLCLIILMAVTGIFVYRFFLAGRSVYAFYGSGSDTTQQYIPSLLTVVHKLRNGDFSFWESNMGFGADILINQSHIMDPFHLPFYIFGVLGMDHAMYYSLAVMQLLKCCLTGWLAWLYLGCFPFRNYARILASYCCAFCGFITLWGMHYFFSSACVWMMLIIWLLEKSLREPRFRIFLTLAVFAELMASLYLGFMIAVMCFLYLVIRLFLMRRELGRGGVIRVFLLSAVSVAAAAAMAGVILLPVYYQLTEVSTRLNGSGSILDKLRAAGFFYSLPMYHTLVLRMFSNNFQGTESFYQGSVSYIEAIQLYFSLIMFPSAVLFFSEGMVHSRLKKTYAAGAVLAAGLVFLPLTAYIFNRGVNAATRYTFVFIPFAAWILAHVLTHIHEFHRSSLLTGWICCGCGYLYLYMHRAILDQYHLYRHFVLTLAGSLAFLAAVSYLSMRAGKTAGGCRVVLLGVLLLTAVNVTAESDITVNAMRSVSMADMVSLNGRRDWTEPGLAYIRKAEGDEVCRTEKTYVDKMDWCEPQTEDYPGISYYNTTYNKHVVDFIYKVWPDIMYLPQLGHNYVVFRNDYANAQMAALMDIRYVCSTVGPSLGADAYQLVSDRGVYVYENRLAGGMGILFDRLLTEQDLSEAGPEERQKLLQDHLVLENIPEGLEDLYDAAPAEAADPDYYRRHGVSFVRMGSDGRMQADLEAEREELLFVSLPLDEGWRAEVNGEPAEILRADYGFQAVRVPAGASHVVFAYRTPWMKEGLVCSLAGLLLFSGLCLYEKRRSGKRR